MPRFIAPSVIAVLLLVLSAPPGEARRLKSLSGSIQDMVRARVAGALQKVDDIGTGTGDARGISDYVKEKVASRLGGLGGADSINDYVQSRIDEAMSTVRSRTEGAIADARNAADIRDYVRGLIDKALADVDGAGGDRIDGVSGINDYVAERLAEAMASIDIAGRLEDAMDGVAGGGGIDGLNDYINDLVQDSLDEVNDKVEDAINNVNGIADDAKKRAGDAIDDARASTDERVGEVDMRSLRESLLLRLSGIQARRPVDVKRDGESFKLRDVIFDSNIP